MRTSVKIFIAVSVVGTLALLAGLGVLIWWAAVLRHQVSTNILVEGIGLGGVAQTAALTRLGRAGSLFWWFFPTVGAGAAASSRPVVLWLGGVTGPPPSLASFAAVGPLDFNLDNRNDSWVNEYNLLFVDAPLGTGFSAATSDSWIPTTLDQHIDYLVHVLEAFYGQHAAFADSPLFVLGHAHGAQLALALAARLAGTNDISHNLQGVILGNGIVSPARTLTQLGWYLEEMGYVDGQGRAVIEDLSEDTNSLVGEGRVEDAYDRFLSLGQVVNEEAGTVAVNLGRIIDKLTNDTVDAFGARSSLQTALAAGGLDVQQFMETVGRELGVPAAFDTQRAAAQDAFRSVFMVPSVELVEHILSNTTLRVAIYNGNLDAVSNTPGQLAWVESLRWGGQEEFLSSPRRTLVVNSVVQGYFRETDRLHFYWINAAGQSVPEDSPDAARRIMRRIVDNV